MFFNTKLVSVLKTKSCVCVWSWCWPLPFPTKSAVDKQASPQTQEGRLAPSTHLCNMGTFHHWWSKTHRQTRMGYQKVTWPGGPSSTPAFLHIGCQQASSLLQHRGGSCEGRRSSAPLADPPESTWIKANGGATCTGPSRRRLTRTLHHHSELPVTLTETYSAPKQRGRPTLNSPSACAMRLGLSSFSVRRHASSLLCVCGAWWLRTINKAAYHRAHQYSLWARSTCLHPRLSQSPAVRDGGHRNIKPQPAQIGAFASFVLNHSAMMSDINKQLARAIGRIHCRFYGIIHE